MENGEDVISSSAPELAPALQKKRKCTTIKFVVAAMAIGLLLYLCLSDSGDEGRCNLFHGQWIPNRSGPSYNNASCKFIDDSDNCLRNGRPDSHYLYWRWKPYHCDLPPFDPVVFMNRMRHKSWAAIGDSILRNQMQSLICLVSEVEEPIEIYHDKSYKARTFYFPNHNFTIATKWAPFLVKAVFNENEDGKDNSTIQLFLDILEASWTNDYHKYDYILIAGGQWFLKTTVAWENNSVIGCHNCGTKNLKELGVYEPYRKALQHVFDYITSSDHKPFVVFRTWSPDHFEYGEWYNGGICNRSEPYREGQFNGSPNDHNMKKIEVEEYDKAKVVASKRGIQLELLDIFHLSLLRPDGHPGPYRRFDPFHGNKSAKVQNDCLHWCVPGPVDTWNDLMMKILSKSGALNLLTSYEKPLQGLELLYFQ
ncbi:uncharacterized protein A4U43_UnF5880 [Asparagus officinalis]|uniref:Uncharacterized protein n=1 Tax=Asparagus officinalis TaxID=4686 RepID=A0A1R3L6L0_ASPOF|nr:protein trichome birefringence-like 26 [Asparagus officinalis]ONK55250.1 uncharacterized protein A4U43_UnF5880 [Asparagus officinalis]